VHAALEFSSLSLAEVRTLVGWAAREGWYPGVHDAATFWLSDPEGFLALRLDGEFAGGGGIVRHNPNFGFMGLFILDSRFRGRGWGHRLWYERRDRLLSRLSSPATIGLDAVEAMIPFYARGGFQPYYRHVRFSGSPVAERSLEVCDLAAIGRCEIHAYDGSCFPGPRTAYLDAWLAQPEAQGMAVIRRGELQGYGVLRRCSPGWKLGPLFADSLEVADLILKHAASLVGSGPILLDAPENNPLARQLCEQHQMQPMFECTRMYLGPAPELQHHRIYGITTMELG
jgi:GNAT superfamily N-acetyltransferase